MKILMLVTADYASIDRATGKMNVLGVFGQINSRTFPVRHPRIALALKLRAELGDMADEHILNVTLKDEDGIELLRLESIFALTHRPSGDDRELNAVLEINNLVFPHPGLYEFEVWVSENLVGRTSVKIVQAQPTSGE